MLRDKSLIPLSHQHQHALALCVRIDRGSPIPEADLPQWLEEIAQHFWNEIQIHFSAEEKVLFPIARHFGELNLLIDELLAEHAILRENFASAESKTMSPENVLGFARRLSAHIRKEEGQLFERLQKLLTAEQLAGLGADLNETLKNASSTCALPAARKKRQQ
jgi:hemerythrin-like domain-containing protein